jgi:hypothetical protein
MERTLQLLIPVLALAIPVAGVVFYGLHRLLRLRIEQVHAGVEAPSGAELEALRTEVAELRAELGEVHERLDFTERVLTQDRERQRIAGERQAD